MSGFPFAGKTLEIKVDNGVIFHNTYSDDGKQLHYETIAGPTEGASEDVELHAAEVSPGVYIVGWTEISGKTVAHALNFNTSTVHAFWTQEVGKGRIGELHPGSITEL